MGGASGTNTTEHNQEVSQEVKCEVKQEAEQEVEIRRRQRWTVNVTGTEKFPQTETQGSGPHG